MLCHKSTFWQKPKININIFLTSGQLKTRKQDLKQKTKIGEYSKNEYWLNILTDPFISLKYLNCIKMYK